MEDDYLSKEEVDRIRASVDDVLEDLKATIETIEIKRTVSGMQAEALRSALREAREAVDEQQSTIDGEIAFMIEELRQLAVESSSFDAFAHQLSPSDGDSERLRELHDLLRSGNELDDFADEFMDWDALLRFREKWPDSLVVMALAEEEMERAARVVSEYEGALRGVDIRVGWQSRTSQQAQAAIQSAERYATELDKLAGFLARADLG